MTPRGFRPAKRGAWRLWPMAARSLAGSMLKVAGSMATKTGVAPTNAMTSAVAMNVNGVVKIRSPRPTPWASRVSSRASVPLAQLTAWPTPLWPASRASSAATSGPMMNLPWASTVWMRPSTASLMRAYWALRSIKGIMTVASPVSRPGGRPEVLFAGERGEAYPVGGVGVAPGRTGQVRSQPFAAGAHPADAAGRIADHEGVVRHVARHHGPAPTKA
jgi:hypothetical protein